MSLGAQRGRVILSWSTMQQQLGYFALRNDDQPPLPGGPAASQASLGSGRSGCSYFTCGLRIEKAAPLPLQPAASETLRCARPVPRRKGTQRTHRHGPWGGDI